jgi:hypothetical protein
LIKTEKFTFYVFPSTIAVIVCAYVSWSAIVVPLILTFPPDDVELGKLKNDGGELSENIMLCPQAGF